MATSYKSNNNWLSLLICPIWAFIKSIGDADSENSRAVLIAFCAIIGWSMFPYRQGMDIYEYFQMFDYISSMSKEQYLDGLYAFLSLNERVKDYYFETVVYFVSRFSSNIHYCYMIFGLVFGIFFSGAISVIVENIKKHSELNKYYKLLLFTIVFSIPFTLISSVRFWTAAWLGIYVVLRVFIEGKYRYLLLLPIAIFIHGTYMVFCILLIAGLIICKIETPFIRKALILLLYLSIPFSYLSFSFADAVYSFLPAPLQHTADSYLDEDRVEYINNLQATGWGIVANVFDYLRKTFEAVLVILMTLKRSKQDDDGYNRLFIILLIILSFSNFTSAIPSLGKRYYVLSMPLMYFMWCVTFAKGEHYSIIQLIPYIFSVPLFLWFYQSLYGSTGIYPILVSPIIPFLMYY